jgi:hypothetical protein
MHANRGKNKGNMGALGVNIVYREMGKKNIVWRGGGGYLFRLNYYILEL